jgi:hypothetical protein
MLDSNEHPGIMGFVTLSVILPGGEAGVSNSPMADRLSHRSHSAFYW